MMKEALLASVLTAVSMTAVLGQQPNSMFSPEALTRNANTTVILKTLAARTPPLTPMDTIVIHYGRGGNVNDHHAMYAGYRSDRKKVEIRGPCHSACTLVTAYIDKPDLCFAPGSFLGFHQVRALETGEVMPLATHAFYLRLPADIRGWIDRTGGWPSMPLTGYWPLNAADLWAMGYPKCN
jgi:hypothetical protein